MTWPWRRQGNRTIRIRTQHSSIALRPREYWEPVLRSLSSDELEVLAVLSGAMRPLESIQITVRSGLSISETDTALASLQRQALAFRYSAVRRNDGERVDLYTFLGVIPSKHHWTDVVRIDPSRRSG